jgi:hypothetical protein
MLEHEGWMMGSVFDGGEIESTYVVGKWRLSVVLRNWNKTTNANDNFAPREFALAA